MRFHYHRPKEIWENLKDLDLPRRTFSSELSKVPTVQHFITEDEIDTAMTGGSSFAGGKSRIYAFFMENHTDKEKVRFLKDEYGIGGRSHALSGATHSGVFFLECLAESRVIQLLRQAAGLLREPIAFDL